MSQQINLFNPIFLKQKKIFTTDHMVQTLGAIAAGVVLIAGYGSYKTSELSRQAEAGKAQLARSEARLAEVTRDFSPRQKNPALAEEVARRQADIAALRDVQAVLERGDLGNTSGYSEYLRAFAHQRAPGVWLTGLSLAGAGSELTVQGRALQPDQVPSYIQGLTRETILRGKTFGSLEIGRPAAAPGSAASPAPEAPYVDFRLSSQVQEAKK